MDTTSKRAGHDIRVLWPGIPIATLALMAVLTRERLAMDSFAGVSSLESPPASIMRIVPPASVLMIGPAAASEARVVTGQPLSFEPAPIGEDDDAHRDAQIASAPVGGIEQEPPTPRQVRFFDDPLPPRPRMITTINPVAVRAIMNWGAQVPPLPRLRVFYDPMPQPPARASFSHRRYNPPPTQFGTELPIGFRFGAPSGTNEALQ